MSAFARDESHRIAVVCENPWVCRPLRCSGGWSRKPPRRVRKFL